MGLLEDMLASSGSEMGNDPLAQMATDMIFGQGESTAQDTDSRFKKVLLGMAGAGGLIGGGGAKGALNVITPKGWSNIAPEAKAAVNMFANQFPEWFGAVMKHPRELGIQGAPNLPINVAGQFFNRNPLLDQILLSTKNWLGQDIAPSSATIGHELTHYLTADQLKKWLPQHAEQLGQELNKVLPKGGKSSLTGRLNELADIMKNINPEVRANSPTGGMIDDIKRAIGAEGLAHLAERTVYPETPTKIMDLARKLGVGAPAYEASSGSTLMDDVLKSLAELGQTYQGR
jgi:hypothetical protein